MVLILSAAPPAARTPWLPFQGPIPPIRGKCPEGTKGGGMLSAKQTERSLQICSCRSPPAAPSFPSCRKRRGRKGALGCVWCFLHLNLGEAQCFRLVFHSIVTLRVSYCAPPDSGVTSLQLVALEPSLSIEGALEIQMNFTFLRGPSLWLPLVGEGFQERYPFTNSKRTHI